MCTDTACSGGWEQSHGKTAPFSAVEKHILLEHYAASAPFIFTSFLIVVFYVMIFAFGGSPGRPHLKLNNYVVIKTPEGVPPRGGDTTIERAKWEELWKGAHVLPQSELFESPPVLVLLMKRVAVASSGSAYSCKNFRRGSPTCRDKQGSEQVTAALELSLELHKH